MSSSVAELRLPPGEWVRLFGTHVLVCSIVPAADALEDRLVIMRRDAAGTWSVEAGTGTLLVRLLES